MESNNEFEKFVSEMEQYSVPDLELICNTQKELYSDEEMAAIQDILRKKKVVSKKTGDKFYIVATIFCIAALLLPVAGLVAGVIMIIAGIKGDPKWKSAGKKTLVAVIISVMLRSFLYSGGFKIC